MKKITLVILALAVMAGLVSATFSLYNTSVEIQQTNVSSKLFYIGEEKTINEPAFVENCGAWKFAVFNFTNGAALPSTYDMHVRVALNQDANLSGLSVGLFSGSGQQLCAPVGLSNAGTELVLSNEFQAGVAKSGNYELRLLYNGKLLSADNTPLTAEKYKISVTVSGTAVQASSSSAASSSVTSSSAASSGSVSSNASSSSGSSGSSSSSSGTGTDQNIMGQVSISKQDGTYILEIKNTGTADIMNGWKFNLDNSWKTFFRDYSSCVTVSPKDGLWNVLDMLTSPSGDVQTIYPKAGGYAAPIDVIKAGTSVKIKLNMNGSGLTMPVSTLPLLKPYDASKVAVSFEDTNVDQYNGNIYAWISNTSDNCRMYGWTLQFTVNTKINSMNIRTGTLSLLSSQDGWYTYKIVVPAANNEGPMCYIDAGSKNQVCYFVAERMQPGSKFALKDVLLDGKPIFYIAP